MDVICLQDTEGFYHCTEFYIKFRLQHQTTNLILGISVIDKKTPLQEKFLESFPTATNGELYELAKQDVIPSSKKNIPPQQTSITNEPDFVEITVNDIVHDDIIAFIGDNLLLYFYDSTIHQYFTTPNQTILNAFQLIPGKNTVKCVHRASQTTREFNIYLLRKDASFVIMDIDGTITKSDVTGYIQTVYMGMFSYIHDGVIEFLNYLVSKYNYHILYLTARPMVHRRMTTQLLQQCRSEDGQTLPDGPLITSRDRISMALYKEVILKDSATTKWEILGNIVDVFKAAGNMNLSPFVLGVGNKEHDAIAYNSAGVPSDRIFLIDQTSKIQVWRYSQQPVSTTPSLPPPPPASSSSANASTKDGSNNFKFFSPFPLSRANSGKHSPYTLPAAPAPTPASSAANSRTPSKDQGDTNGGVLKRSFGNGATSPATMKNKGRYINGSPANFLAASDEDEDEDKEKDDKDDEDSIIDPGSNGHLYKPSAPLSESGVIEKRRCPNCEEVDCTCSSMVSLPFVYTFQTYKDKQLYRYVDYLATAPFN